MTTQPAWWKTGVIYQIYPRSFKDSTGNGIGDLAGIIEQLDYFTDQMPVDVIWLSPFYPSPMADFGYDVSDYTNVHPLFGDLDTFDKLVDEVHKRDLKIIIDFVPNHSSDQHAWFIESRSSRDNPKRDWYVWRDAKPGGSPPNNWIGVFGGSMWEWDEATGQYYLHSFLKGQPDLNWRNPEVKAAMFDAMRFWLDRGIDGFRIDVAHHLMKDPLERDNPPVDDTVVMRHKAMGEYDLQMHVNDVAHADIHPLMREFRALLDSYSATQPRFAVGEIHDFNWESWASYYGENEDELHMPFNFLTLAAPWTATGIRDIVSAMEKTIPPTAWPNYVLGNHDEKRLATRYGQENTRLAAMLLLTLRGTPTLYYGDEIGIEEAIIPREQQQDPWGLRAEGLSRDGCRTPMQWNDSAGAGFSSTIPWLPVHQNKTTKNVATQQENPRSLLNFYKALLLTRKQHPALHIGSYKPYRDAPANCFGYYRTYNEQHLLVLLNFSDTALPCKLPSNANLLLSTKSGRRAHITFTEITLQPREGVVFDLGSFVG
ncbi:MAG: alpha-amylase family glycosyl hydrolase [Bacteroidota bacterium]